MMLRLNWGTTVPRRLLLRAVAGVYHVAACMYLYIIACMCLYNPGHTHTHLLTCNRYMPVYMHGQVQLSGAPAWS